MEKSSANVSNIFNELHAHLFIDQIDNPVLVQNTNHKILFQNQKARDVFGDHHGKHCYSIFNKRKKICAGCPLSKCLKKKKPVSAEIRLRQNGNSSLFNVTATPISNASGNILGGIEIFQEIREKHKERRQTEFRKDWEETFNTLEDMITIHDENYNIVFANRAALKILKLPLSGDHINKCFTYYHGTKSPPPNCKSCSTLKNGKSGTFEFYEPHLDKFIEIRVLPRIGKNSKVKGLIHIARDITKRKKTDDTLLKSQDELRAQAKQLQETNTALKVLLNQRNTDRSEMENNISLNLSNLIMPYLEKISQNSSLSENERYVKIIKSNMDEIISSFSITLSSKYFRLSPKEIQIANLIKEGKQTKEIAEILKLSIETINSHRQHIRKKLGVTSKKINLMTYLNSFDD